MVSTQSLRQIQSTARHVDRQAGGEENWGKFNHQSCFLDIEQCTFRDSTVTKSFVSNSSKN